MTFTDKEKRYVLHALEIYRRDGYQRVLEDKELHAFHENTKKKLLVIDSAIKKVQDE